MDETTERTLEVTFTVADRFHDMLIAELSDYAFNAFEEGEGYLCAYGPGEDWTEESREAIRRWLTERGAAEHGISKRWISPRNWNEIWARSVQPVRVGPFYVTPSAHEIPGDVDPSYVIRVDPKMTFGTGQHESTRLAMRLLCRRVEPGDHLLDAGAGTGILSVAALQRGAAHVVAFDNHPAAREHAREVLRANGVEAAADFRTGGIETIQETGFDGILANINRTVLAGMMPRFVELISDEGWIILSGLMTDSRPAMEQILAEHGLKIIDEAEEGEWYGLCVKA